MASQEFKNEQATYRRDKEQITEDLAQANVRLGIASLKAFLADKLLDHCQADGKSKEDYKKIMLDNNTPTFKGAIYS